LKDHANTSTDLNHINRWCVDVLSIKEDISLNPAERDKVIHAIEATQQRALTATRWSYQRCDVVRRKVKGNIIKCPGRTIKKTQVLRRHSY
jgi:hypothetical protein